MTATGGTSSLPPQPIIQYNFEDGSGTTAADSSANGNNGTVSPAVVWAGTGRNGGGVTFAATDASITMPTGVLLNTHALTISAWVNLTASALENRLFYFGTDTTYLTLVLNDSGTPAGISLRFKGPTGGELVLTSPTQLPTVSPTQLAGVWKHVAVTLSSAGAAMYIDGKIVAQDNSLAIDPATLGSTTTNLVGSSPTAQVFQGSIDEFYVYNYVMPLSEIQQLAWPKTDYSVYHFDEGTGTNAADSSDRAIAGTLEGGASWVSSPFGTGVMLANNPTVAPAQQYVTLANGIIPTNCANGTFAAWINLTSNDTDAPVFEFGTGTTTSYTSFTTYSTTDAVPVLSFNWYNGTKSGTVRQKSAVYSNGQWTHIAAVRGPTVAAGVTYPGRYEAVYENGVLKASLADTKTGAGFVVPTMSYIGRSYVATTPGFNGAIDEVLVACRQYTADEIKQLAYVPSN